MSKRRSEVTRQTNAVRYAGAQVAVACAHCAAGVVRAKSRVDGRADIYCSTACRSAHRRSKGLKFLNSGGYVVVGVEAGYPGARKNGRGGQITEHRKVMQDFLGRQLAHHESVHHINGVRTDNRIENLELWSTSQPSGQRVADKIKWAQAIIAQYEDLPPELR